MVQQAMAEVHAARTRRGDHRGVSARQPRNIGSACRSALVWTVCPGIVGLLLFSATSVGAQTIDPCWQSRPTAGGVGRLEPLGVTDQLETAWNANDLTAARA